MFEVFSIVQTQGLQAILKRNLSMRNLKSVAHLAKALSFSLVIRISSLRYSFRLRVTFVVLI